MAPNIQPANGYARWGFVGSIVTAAAVFVTGIIWVGGIASDVNALKLQSQRHEITTQDFIAFRARNCQELAKIETQFGTVEEVMNDIHVHDLRDMQAIKFKLFAEPPSGIYHDIQIPHEIEPCN